MRRYHVPSRRLHAHFAAIALAFAQIHNPVDLHCTPPTTRLQGYETVSDTRHQLSSQGESSQPATKPPPPADEEEEERDLVVPILVAIALAAYTAIAIIGLFF